MEHDLASLTDELSNSCENAPDDLHEIIARYISDDDNIIDSYIFLRPNEVISWTPLHDREKHFLDLLENIQGEIYVHTKSMIFAYVIYDDQENALHQIPFEEVQAIDFFDDDHLNILQIKRGRQSFIVWGAEENKEEFERYSKSFSQTWQEWIRDD